MIFNRDLLKSCSIWLSLVSCLNFAVLLKSNRLKASLKHKYSAALRDAVIKKPSSAQDIMYIMLHHQPELLIPC